MTGRARFEDGGRRACAGLFAAALLAVAWGAAGPSAAAPSTYILGVDITAVDQNGNGLYEYLNVSAVLSPPTPGSYLVAATVRWPQTGTTLATVSTLVSFTTGGTQSYPLQLDGAAISEKQLDGPYNLTIDFLSSPPGALADSASFPTGPFKASDFERSGEKDKPRLAVGEDEIRLSSPSINATVNLTSPGVRWGSPQGAAPPFEFEARFPRVVAFADDGDRAFESGELSCEAPLGTGNWSITALEVGPSADWGSYIRFTLASRVDFRSASCATGPQGRLLLTFLITQRNATVEGATPFPLQGGLEVKVDMRLELDGPLPSSDLAFEVELRELGGNLSYLLRGPTGYERVAPSGGPTNITPLAPGLPADIERVSFVDAAGVSRGHFAWLALAAQNLSTGQERFVQVSASQGVEGGALRLFLAVPNDAALRAVLLDPAVGVPSPAPGPPTGNGTQPEPPAEPPSLLVFVAALAAVSAMFFFSIYARAKKR